MRSAAPIEGQLSFGVLLEEPVPADVPAPSPAEGAQSPASPATRAPGGPAQAVPSTPAPGVERADPQDWHAILDFERGWSGSPGAKQRAVRDRFGIGSARYHQLLDRALERPEALVYDPGLVGRLRRLREARRRKRFAERLEVEVDPPADPVGGPADRPSDPKAGQGGGEG